MQHRSLLIIIVFATVEINGRELRELRLINATGSKTCSSVN